MPGTYFELLDDVYFEGRWHLDDITDNRGVEFDGRDMRYGRPVTLTPRLMLPLRDEDTLVEAETPLFVPLQYAGIALDFTFGAFGLPVVTLAVAGVLSSVAGADIPRIPAQVESQDQHYEIINVISSIDTSIPPTSAATVQRPLPAYTVPDAET